MFPDAFGTQLEELCVGNKYATTLQVISSGIIKVLGLHSNS